jgi:hypothetical protein
MGSPLADARAEARPVWNDCYGAGGRRLILVTDPQRAVRRVQRRAGSILEVVDGGVSVVRCEELLQEPDAVVAAGAGDAGGEVEAAGGGGGCLVECRRRRGGLG